MGEFYQENYWNERPKATTEPTRIRLRALLVILGFLFFVACLGLIDYYDSLPEPGTDSGVGCVDDCLSPAEEPEPQPTTWEA